LCPATAPAGIAVAATHGELSLDFGVDIRSSGVDVRGSIGSFQGLPLVVYEQQPWPELGYTLYQGLAVGTDAWRLVWFYCSRGKLLAVYDETTSGGGPQGMTSTGDCVVRDEPRLASVDLPAATLSLVNRVGEYTIIGSDIVLGCGAPGRMRVGEHNLEWFPFGAVDCRGCGSPGWRELHTILWDGERGGASFAILYLVSPGQVLLQYSLSLPDLVDPGPMQFNAAWTAPD
jgi:hypothetical protein